MPLYDLWPIVGNGYIAPSATVVGEVLIAQKSVVQDGVVIRGDINSVRILEDTFIGENTVIHTAASIPSGAPASVDIGLHVFIGSNCTLYSCIVDDYANIGAGTVILEGARVERGAFIGNGSVVPPGRLIPAKQLWAGNPVQFIRNIYENDELYHIGLLEFEFGRALMCHLQFHEYGHAYMHEEDPAKK